LADEADDVLFELDEGFELEDEDELEVWRFPNNIGDSAGKLQRRAPTITNTSPTQTNCTNGFENGPVSEPALLSESVVIHEPAFTKFSSLPI
jgi:hypothetical protein